MTDTIPTSLAGRYDIGELLGAGGAARTFAGTARANQRPVAIKIFDVKKATDWKDAELFEREARVLKAIEHRAVPAYVDFHLDADAGQAWLVQELAPGRDLFRLRQESTFDETRIRAIAAQVLDVLAWLGERTPPIVHRDVKPHNLVIDDDDVVRLVDFGAVRDAQSAGSGSVTVVGTFGYMAPEQAQGQSDVRSDLYGLGMTLVFLLTKVEPKDLPQRSLKPEFRSHAQASPAFLDFVERLIEPIPDARFASAREARDALATLEASTSAASAAPSAASIRALAQRDAEVRARRAPSTPRPATSKPPKQSRDRVTVEQLDDGALLTVSTSGPFRGRGWVVGVVGFIWIIVEGTLAASGASPVQQGIVFVVTALICAASVFSSYAFRLRVTNDGHFAAYYRKPTRPLAAGRVEDLLLSTTVTQQEGDIRPDEQIMYLTLGRKHENFYPLTAADASRAHQFAKANKVPRRD